MSRLRRCEATYCTIIGAEFTPKKTLDSAQNLENKGSGIFLPPRSMILRLQAKYRKHGSYRGTRLAARPSGTTQLADRQRLSPRPDFEFDGWSIRAEISCQRSFILL